MADRKPMSKKLRFEIFKRDKFTCQYCGRTPPTVVLEVDHIIPVASDGPDDDTNLLTSCFDCNRGKSANDLGQVIPAAAVVLEEKRIRAEQSAAYNEMLLEIRNNELATVSRIGEYWFSKFITKTAYEFPSGSPAEQSIRRFLQNLTETEIIDAIDIAHARKPVYGERDGTTFKYFCGICWNIIKNKGSK